MDGVDEVLAQRAADDASAVAYAAALSVAAALLACLDRLDEGRPDGVRFWGLFTRAEELRCLGMLRALDHGTVPDGTPLIALDCTRPVNDVRLGAGVVLRVGDSRYTYDPALTHAVSRVAATGAAPWQRRLSESGWCEAAVVQAAGRHPATSLTLPILNYHNQVADDGGGPGLTAEAVHRDDYLALVELLGRVAVELRPESDEGWLGPLRAEADRRFDGSGIFPGDISTDEGLETGDVTASPAT
ncbi:peptidase [Frankia sp. QA3]|uniref:peptidase n=1 Tax=Frankia sp. QA3 TaxID=710111 RepID=UPI000269C738|nr:peptidase [Frankia sp. QA3]EIV94832.1 peptidase family protein [Frankia sp. QA3]